MKTPLIMIGLAVALLACAPKQDSGTDSALDLVVPGQQLTWADGYTMQVAKRTGNELEGVLIVQTSTDGQATMIAAPRGTLAKGDTPNSIKVSLYEAETQRGTTKMKADLMNLVFTK